MFCFAVALVWFIVGIFKPEAFIMAFLFLVGGIGELMAETNNHNIRECYLKETDKILGEFFPRFRVRDTMRESMRHKIESYTISLLKDRQKQDNMRNSILDDLYSSAHQILRYDHRFSSDAEELKTICLTCLDLMCQDGYIKESRRDECAVDVIEAFERNTQ
jgi:hypothetical protein